jgi:hypothetical protein
MVTPACCQEKIHADIYIFYNEKTISYKMFAEILSLAALIQRDFPQMLHHKMLWSLILKIKKQVDDGTLFRYRALFMPGPPLETAKTAPILVDNFSTNWVAMAAMEDRKCWYETIPGQ